MCGATQAAAADPVVIDIPAGVACADFSVRVTIEGEQLVTREFVDRNGNLVRILAAGTGPALTLTNLTSGATFTTKSNGSVTRTVFNPDGTQTVTIIGHNLLILFPSDVPAGPSTTLYAGRVAFTIDANAVFTVLQASGQATDICAALSE
jgi:uncharacterized protein RhaS with RHS repeats